MSETSPIKQYRAKSGHSQGKLGEMIGVDGNTIARWERGSHLPSKRHWPKIKEVMGITPSTLVEHLKEAVQ